MLRLRRLGISLVMVTAVLATSALTAQSNQPPEEFDATAMRSDEFGSGAGRVIMQVRRWSSDAERGLLTQTLLKSGPGELLSQLQKQKSVGTIRTPDSIGYDLRYAHQEPGEEGSRRVVIATDRPISFWEARNQPRTIDYPFTVIQMELDKSGEGKGTLSFATKINVRGNTIELENFTTSPVMLTDVQAKPLK